MRLRESSIISAITTYEKVTVQPLNQASFFVMTDVKTFSK